MTATCPSCEKSLDLRALEVADHATVVCDCRRVFDVEVRTTQTLIDRVMRRAPKVEVVVCSVE